MCRGGPCAIHLTFRVMAADKYLGGTESLALNPTVVRFIWRHASYQSGWSKKQQLLLIDEFAAAAETEVASS